MPNATGCDCNAYAALGPQLGPHIKLAIASMSSTNPAESVMPSFFSAGVAALAFSSLAWAYPNPGTVTGNIDVADPTLCKDDSGTYFLFCTFNLLVLLRDVKLNCPSHRARHRDSDLYGPHGMDSGRDCLDSGRRAIGYRRIH